VTLVLGSGGVSSLTVGSARLAAVRRRYGWPAVMPVVVLAETLTGDHHRDHAVNRFLRACDITPVDELAARLAAQLRTATGRAGTISATDAIVAAVAASVPDPVVVTSDPGDIAALAAHADRRIVVVPV
jgi:predicted nucleic acid-binding protein